MGELETKRADLRKVQKKLADLQASFKENNDKKQQLEKDVDICSKKLDRYCMCEVNHLLHRLKDICVRKGISA